MIYALYQTSLGGLRELQEQKNTVRKQHNLPPLPEDTYEVCRTMRPASPPASAADLIEQQAPRRGARGGKRVSERTVWRFRVWITSEMKLGCILVYLNKVGPSAESAYTECFCLCCQFHFAEVLICNSILLTYRLC